MSEAERKAYHNAATQRYRQRNPEYVKRNRAAHTGYTLKRTYGITLDHFAAILGQQDGRCAICEATTSNSRTNRLAVDHNHDTGETRGLLCGNCNLIVGLCKENVELLVNAANYLAIYNDTGQRITIVPDGKQDGRVSDLSKQKPSENQ